MKLKVIFNKIFKKRDVWSGEAENSDNNNNKDTVLYDSNDFYDHNY